MDDQQDVYELSDNEYEVEEIIDHRGKGPTQEFLIKWKDYDDEYNTWEPRENLDSAKDLLDNYFQSLKSAPTSKSKPTKTKKKEIRQAEVSPVESEYENSDQQLDELSEEEFKLDKDKKDDIDDEPLFQQSKIKSIVIGTLSSTSKPKDVTKSLSPSPTPSIKQKRQYRPRTTSSDESDVDENDNSSEYNVEIRRKRPKRKTTTRNQAITSIDLSDEEERYKEEDDKESQDEFKIKIKNDDDGLTRTSWNTHLDGEMKNISIISDDGYNENIKNWERKIKRVAAMYKTDNDSILALVEWKTGDFSLHDQNVLHQHCPQALINFYENHLTFLSDDKTDSKADCKTDSKTDCKTDNCLDDKTHILSDGKTDTCSDDKIDIPSDDKTGTPSSPKVEKQAKQDVLQSA